MSTICSVSVIEFNPGAGRLFNLPQLMARTKMTLDRGRAGTPFAATWRGPVRSGPPIRGERGYDQATKDLISSAGWAVKAVA